MGEFVAVGDGLDVGEEDCFGGTGAVVLVLEGEEVVVGEHAPPAEEAGRYLRQLFSTRDYFSRGP
jgi:hypothetical protein